MPAIEEFELPTEPATLPAAAAPAVSDEVAALWQTALHEAGHALATLAQGGVVDSIEVRRCGGITAVGGLGTWRYGVMVSAGPIGGEVAAPMPSIESRDPELPTLPNADGSPGQFLLTSSEQTKNLDNDARRIALACITGFETEPDEWAPRRARMFAEARAILEKHRAVHLALAERVFNRGVVDKNEIVEICASIL